MFKKILISVFAFLPFFANAALTDLTEAQEESQVTIVINGKTYLITNKEQLQNLLEEAELEELDPDDEEVQMAGSYITESQEGEIEPL